MPETPSSDRWIALMAVLFLALVAGLAVVQVRVLRGQRGAAPAAHPTETGTWRPLGEPPKSDRAFASTATLGQPLGKDALRLSLTGETRLLQVRASADGLAVWEAVEAGRWTVLASCRWPRPPTAGDQVRVIREEGRLAVVLNQERRLFVPLPLEAWRAGAWESTAPAGPDPVAVAHQKLSTVQFTDDFMHGEGELGEWEVAGGSWAVHALDNPIRSANAFSFWGKGEGATALAGYWFWRNYRLTCAVHPLDTPAFGLLANRADERNTYRLEWRRQTAAQPGALRLVKTLDGRDLTLGESPLSFVPAQWYKLELEQLEGDLRVLIDGTEVLQAHDPLPLASGRIGLWTQGGDGAVFDDVTVEPVDRVAVAVPCAPTDWPAVVSTPQRPAGPPAPGVTGLSLADLGGEARVGGVVLENAALTVGLAGLSRRAGPLELRLRERPAGHVALVLSGTPDATVAELRLVTPGQSVTCARADLAGLADTAPVSLHAEGNRLWAAVAGRLVLCATAPEAAGRGGARVCGQPGAAVRLTHLAFEPQKPLPAIENWVETFAHEESMSTWGRPEADWLPTRDSDRRLVYWHRSDFWGDTSAGLDLSTFDWRTTGAAGLLLAGGDPGSGAPTVRLTLRPDGDGLRVALASSADPPGAASAGGDPKTVPAGSRWLVLERRGGRLLALLDDRLLWDLPLPAALDGLLRVGRYGGEPGEAWARAAAIGAAGVLTYPFNRAPVDWLPASGAWFVTNRWQCDPRWSFFSGYKRHGVACNWHKGRHGPNVTLEFFAGPKMDQERGDKYEYAADINAVVGADGRDIASGYSFLFGGWNDSGSFIARGREPLARNPGVVIPRNSSTHRRWFYIKLRKQGDRLTLWIDGEKAAEARDPSPLAGDRFGLWTWDNGVVIAHLRVSTDLDRLPADVQQTPLPPPRTPYD